MILSGGQLDHPIHYHGQAPTVAANKLLEFEVLNKTMEYNQFEPFESIAQGDNVVVLYHAQGRAKSTGRAFKSDIVRIYTFHEGKLTKVRNYYDTASYVSALRGL